MRRYLVVAAVGLALGAGLGTGAARADEPAASPWDAAAAGAVRVIDGRALAGLFWAATTSCDEIRDDLLHRQCEGVRTARAEANAGRTFLMRADDSALVVGGYDAAKGMFTLTANGCLACAEPLSIAMERRHVVTRGKVTIDGGALIGPPIKVVSRPFAKEQAALKWADKALPRLRTEILFRVPAKPAPWTEGGARGFFVDMIGFRVYDPCDGTVLAAEPASATLPAEEALCAGGLGTSAPVPAVTTEVAVEKGAPGADEPKLPERLSPSAISSAMARARTDVNICFARYGIRGTAYLTIDITGDGVVKDVKLKGDFEDSPTGDCIVSAVKTSQFPKFRVPSMTIKDFPFILR